jgi:glutamyl-Q tRNA(Asp) synthetase
MGYVGRFAPSPTGPLHPGSLVAALASWLDARAHNGRWLVRIEDVDAPRCVPGAAEIILKQLTDCGLVPDEAPSWQSARGGLYQQALDRLVSEGHAYPCACSRKDIERALAAQGHVHERGGELVYPGTCRSGLNGRPARAWRFRTTAAPVRWNDRRLGEQRQDVEREVGDFVLKRADGLWAYQLAVVVDDAAQGITQVVRGEDLADNTARQILLQRALKLPTPGYLHTPLVLGPNGEKLSKQNGAQALDTAHPLRVLDAAAQTIGLAARAGSVPQALASWQAQWRASYNLPGD